MDDWLSNTAGAVPGDGAFERFLTAALAAIITLVFSWRLLGEVSETEREATLRQHAAARSSGQYSASQLGISDEKLREVAEAFAKDRAEKLKSSNNNGGANSNDSSSASAKSVDVVNASPNAEGSCVDTENTVQSHDLVQAESIDTPNELSQELTSEDRKFLEDLLKSSIGTGNAQSHAVSSPVEGDGPGNALLAKQECVPEESDAQQASRYRLSDFSMDGTQVCSDSVTDTERSYSPVDYNTTTTPVDSDEEDDFQEYFGDAGQFHPRVFDSDDESFYRTFLEPIREEMSGEEETSGDEPATSSEEEWGECGASDEESDSRSSTPQATENNATKYVNGICDAGEIPATETDVKTIAEKLSESENAVSVMLGDDHVTSDKTDKSLSDCFVFDAYQTSPEHKLAENGETEETEVIDDSVSEESDDTVIMVFSNLRNREENGTKQSQNEIVYLNQERYDGYRDMFLTEKFEEMDSDDDLIIPPSKHYDQIRNNLTLIGADDDENITVDYDEYERGSWSDPDDNFRCSIPRWDRYGGFVADDFVKPNNSYNDTAFSYDDQCFTWKSYSKKDQNSFKPDTDFEFGNTMHKGYDDAPFSSAAEESPVGFTFVEVKDSITEFSLRNYVREKDNFDPKSDSGIFTDSEEFTSASNAGKLPENDKPNVVDNTPSDFSELQIENGSSAYSDNILEQPDTCVASDIDSETVCSDQCNPAVLCVPADNSPSIATVNSHQSSLNLTNIENNDFTASEIQTGEDINPDINRNETLDVSDPRGTSDILLNERKSGLFDTSLPDPDIPADQTVSFNDEISEICVDIDEGSGESVPVLPNSCQLKDLKQTEISCWSSHSEPFSHSSVDFNMGAGNNDKGETGETFPAHRAAQIKLEHREIVRPASPVSSPEYYTERKRRSHNEAVFLDQFIAPDSELSSYESKEKALHQNNEQSVSASNNGYQKLESSVDPLPGELVAGAINTSVATQGRQTDIDCVSLPFRETGIDNTDRFNQTTLNGSGIALEEKTTPASVVQCTGVESVKMRTKPANKQADSNQKNDGNTEEESSDNSSNRLSITLEESPLICMQPPISKQEQETLTSSVKHHEQSPVNSVLNPDTAIGADEQHSLASPTSCVEESPVICLNLDTTVNTTEQHVPKDNSNSSVLEESPVINFETNNTNDDLEENQMPTKQTVVYGNTESPTDPRDDNVFEETSVSCSPNSPVCPKSSTVLDRGSRVTLPRRYTPSADYRKLLKPTTPRRYNSVLQRPVSSDKLYVNYTLPDRPVPKIRRKILASRQRFLSEDNLYSPNDSFDDAFSDHGSVERYHPQTTRLSASPTSPTNRQSYSVADISRLYASTLSSPRKPRPGIDQLHENCILSPERLALLRSRTFSTDSIGPPRRVSRQPSVSSLVETDIDTGETTENPQFTETDLDVPFRLQNPVEKTVSMMDLRSGRSRFTAKKKAAEERKKSKSLQQLGTNVGSLETDIDAPFPDGSGVARVPSEHELRVTRSLSKLNVPDWLRRSTVYRTGSHFILRRDSNASTISQWSSKSYGPLTTTRDSSRASSCMTLSQPSPVVIRTRVSPSSTGKLMGSGTIGSTTKPKFDSRQVKLPSAKFREKEKPSGLMPIPIVPFEKLRAKFEKNHVNGTSVEKQPVKEVETKIIVEPMKNPPPGILKQTQPMAITGLNYKESESVTIDKNRVNNKSPPTIQARQPPPKITITTEKNVSPKDKTSPSAFEKSVRFSPILNRMDISSGPSVMPPSPEAQFHPVNGGAVGNKPILPPKPTKRMLQWKSSPPINEEPHRAVPQPELVMPKQERIVAKQQKVVQKAEKSVSKPATSEKPSRIANLIRRFKGKDENSIEVCGVGENLCNDAVSEGHALFPYFQKPQSEKPNVGESDEKHVQERGVVLAGPSPPPAMPVEHFEPISPSDDPHCHVNLYDTVHATFRDTQTNTCSSLSPANCLDNKLSTSNHSSSVSLDEVLGSLLALGMRRTTSPRDKDTGKVNPIDSVNNSRTYLTE